MNFFDFRLRTSDTIHFQRQCQKLQIKENLFLSIFMGGMYGLVLCFLPKKVLNNILSKNDSSLVPPGTVLNKLM